MNRASTLPSWTTGRTAFLDEVSSTNGTLKIVLKTKDDHHFLDRWIAHHAAIVGLEHLAILDNMSTDDRVLSIYREHQGRIPVVQFDGFHNRVHTYDAMADLYECLKRSCEFFVFLDTDEFLVHIDGDRCTRDGTILEYLRRNDTPSAIPGTWLPNRPGSSTRFALGSSVQDFSLTLTWGKPILRAAATAPGGHYNHVVQIDESLFGRRIGLNLFVQHLKNFPRQRIESNFRKLVSWRAVSPDESLESVMRRTDLDQLPYFGKLTREMKALAREEAALSEDSGSLGWLEVQPDGALHYSDSARRRALHAYLANAQDAARAMLWGDAEAVDRTRRRIILTQRLVALRRGEPDPTGALDTDGDALRQELQGHLRHDSEPDAPTREYAQLQRRLHDRLDPVVPIGATVLVVSGGDDGLVRLAGRAVEHFPRAADGTWNGHPADSRSAIEQLEAIGSATCLYLIIPGPSMWWLDHYPELRRYLDERHRALANIPDTCAVFELSGLGDG